MSKLSVYGFPCVEDPNDFIPDGESCSPEELERHRKACLHYGKPAFESNKSCYSEYSEDGQLVKHVLRTSWGIGTNLINTCDECQKMALGEVLISCHECGGMELCEVCWPKHEKWHDAE